MRIPLLLYAFAFIVRLALVWSFPDPAYPDSYYYVDVARALAAGNGFNLDFIWIFGEVGGRIPDVPVLPVPSNAHWLPLSSMIQAAFILVLGPTAFASALPLVIIGSLIAPLVYLIAGEAGCRREVRIGAALLAAAPGAGAVFMPQPENFAILQPLVAAVLYLLARGLKGHVRSYIAAGFLVGLASLARNDGIFLGLTTALVFALDRGRALLSRGTIRPAIPFLAAVACFALYLLVMTPWWMRQIAVFGSISPTASSGSALWIRTMAEWNSITAEPSLGKFLAQGVGPIVESRVLGFVAAVGNFAVIIGSVVLMPFMVIGAWTRRRSRDFQPWFIHLVVVFMAATLIYPVHIPGGAFIHSAIGLSGPAYILALEGVLGGVGWIAARRKGWNVQRAGPIYVAALVIFVLALVPLYAGAVHRSWNASRQQRIALAAALDGLGVGRDERLYSIDSAGMKYWTGRGGVVTPDDPIETIEAVARAYDLRWLVIEKNDAASALAPVLRGESRPSWIGPPAFIVPAPDGGLPVLVLYPVCTVAGDARCADAPVLAGR